MRTQYKEKPYRELTSFVAIIIIINIIIIIAVVVPESFGGAVIRFTGVLYSRLSPRAR